MNFNKFIIALISVSIVNATPQLCIELDYKAMTIQLVLLPNINSQPNEMQYHEKVYKLHDFMSKMPNPDQIGLFFSVELGNCSFKTNTWYSSSVLREFKNNPVKATNRLCGPCFNANLTTLFPKLLILRKPDINFMLSIKSKLSAGTTELEAA